ncbi:hypothetical protein Daus18300_004985 [Diaporthe australafricana]|uniref:NACHT domain-containing protein n=1 Tax=Diaporthe australafricana TaxID=127596 RepID=A0ABR3X5A0_9PEZI
MDGFSAVSLAGNVAQFVEYGIRIIRKTQEIAKSTQGVSKEVEELKTIVDDIDPTLRSIKNRSNSDDNFDDDDSLQRLVEKCLDLSPKVSDILESLRLKDSHGPRPVQALRKAAQTLHKKGEMDQLSTRLFSLRSQISAHLIVLIENDMQQFYEKNLGRLLDGKKQSILKSLSFSQLVDRESVIPTAHQQTFEWMLAEVTDQNFVEWLRHESCTFWVSGKAGSGKSTLMKFLTEHSRTQQILAEWADGDLVIAKHFFWRPGTPLQKSQEGLLRSLLLQILTKKPDLIPHVCSERWAGPYGDCFLPWTRSQLIKAMQDLKSKMADAETCTEFNFKLCIFVDGLDEFDGDHFELVRILSDLVQPTRAKMCVSSRPWLEFSDAFGDTRWMIEVHELTRQDMLLYVRDNLESDDKFARLRTRDADSASALISNVVTRSEGVFLWVYLVVRSLLRGLRYEDSMRDLKHRMEALPPDLETYFGRMLHEIEDVYRQRTARLFLALSVARTSLPVLTFFFLNFDDDAAQVEPDAVESLGKWPEIDPRYLEALETKKRQLVAQCKDIIHVNPGERGAPILFGQTVGFLHRTVFDFINTEETYRHLERLAGSSFIPKRPLFDANLGQVKAMIHLHARSYIKPHLNHWILGTLFYAYEMEVGSADSCAHDIFEGLDELDQVISKQFATWDFQHAIKTLLGRDDFTSFIQLAAINDLASYVKYKCPHLTPDRLDVLAPGWRSPSRVEQLGTFEIIPQTPESHWRLGSVLGVPFGTGECSELDESPEQPVDHFPKNDPGFKNSQELFAAGNSSVEVRTSDLHKEWRNAGGGRVHRAFRRLATMWRRS